jgi:hypothetical protein
MTSHAMKMLVAIGDEVCLKPWPDRRTTAAGPMRSHVSRVFDGWQPQCYKERVRALPIVPPNAGTLTVAYSLQASSPRIDPQCPLYVGVICLLMAILGACVYRPLTGLIS